MIRHCPVGFTPNLTCLLRDAPEASASDGGVFAVATGASVNESGAALTELPLVEEEARAACAAFEAAGAPASLRLGEDARTGWIDDPEARAAAARARVLHFGLHGAETPNCCCSGLIMGCLISSIQVMTRGWCMLQQLP